MSDEVVEQLRAYAEQVDAASRVVDIDLLTDPATTGTPHLHEPRGVGRQALGIGAAAAAVVVAIAAGSLWFTRETSPTSDTLVPVTDPAGPTTIPTPTAPRVSTPPTTDGLGDGSPAVADTTSVTNDFEVIDVDELVDEIGTFTWTKLTGDRDTVPNDMGFFWQLGQPPFLQEDDGSYVFYGTDRTWRSGDGLSWTFEPGTLDADALEGFVDAGAWSVDGLVVTRADGSTTQQFELPTPAAPDVDGLDVSLLTHNPLTVGEQVYVAGSWHGSLPWDDVYGTWDECSSGECFDQGPLVLVGEAWVDNQQFLDDDRAWVLDPLDGMLIATLDIVVTDEAIRFRDAESGAEVHTVTSSDPDLIATLVERLPEYAFPGQPLLSVPMGWFGSADEPFVAGDPPPGEAWSLVAIPDGGVGDFSGLTRDTSEQAADEVPALSAQVLINGGRWMEVTPAFVSDRVWEARVALVGDLLVADVVYRAGGTERWTSTNGIDWKLDFQYPTGSFLHAIDGMPLAVDMKHVNRAVGYPEIHISADGGQHWAKLPGPPTDSYHDYPEGAGEMVGVAGDLVYISIASTPPTDSPIMWIGRFER